VVADHGLAPVSRSTYHSETLFRWKDRVVPLTVEVVEVGPRDGLQNEPEVLSTEQKAELVRRAVAAGARRVEVASFVNPARVPQLADAEAVLEAVSDVPDLVTSGLVLNERGAERALATSVAEVNVVVVSTDTFSQRNSGMPTDAAVEMAARVAKLVAAEGRPVAVTLAAAFGCPFEGEVPVRRVAELAGRVAVDGVTEVALADTIGVGVPADVRARVAAVRAAVPDGVRLRAHFHNTRNTGYANALAAVEAGLDVLDSSLGGIGGCPFAPNATGNIATEDLVYLLHRSGIETGLDLEVLRDGAVWIGEQLGRQVPGLLSRAGGFPAS
jgi:hydroxymethylglutaryl-CoA lyase